MKILLICPPHLSDVATLPWEIQKKSFSIVLFKHTSDYLWHLRRKQTVIHSPTPYENVTTLTCELQNFFIWLKVCCILSNVGGFEESQLWAAIGGSEKNCCNVWQLECQASNVTASVQSDQLLHYVLPVFFDTDQSHSTPCCAEIQAMS